MSQEFVGPIPPHRIFPDWLSPAQHAELLQWTLAREEQFEPTTVIRGTSEVVDPESRVSSRLSLSGSIKEAFVRDVRERALSMLEGAGTRPFPIGRVEVELAAHNDGAHFYAHTDIPVGTERQSIGAYKGYDRVVSAVYYFHGEPKGFSGGELRLYRFGGGDADGDYVDISPKQNSLLVFPSWAKHEVRRVSCPSGRFSDSRFAINCWLHRERAD